MRTYQQSHSKEQSGAQILTDVNVCYDVATVTSDQQSHSEEHSSTQLQMNQSEEILTDVNVCYDVASVNRDIHDYDYIEIGTQN